MKKLMIMAAIACATVAAQAECSFYWDAYLEDSVSMNLYYKDFRGGVSLINTQETWEGYVFGANPTMEQITSSGTYDFYVIAYDANNRYATSDMQSLVVEQKHDGMFAATETLTFNSFTAWQTVPEPTSGVLMLLGLAGLALKRKRA